MKYGERFRELRKARWHDTVLALARRLDMDYPTSIYNIEQSWRVPTLPTLEKHAAALGCEPWELLQNVETEYDLARALGKRPLEVARREWRELVGRYEESTRRGKRPTTKEPRAATSARAAFRLAAAKRGGVKAGR